MALETLISLEGSIRKVIFDIYELGWTGPNTIIQMLRSVVRKPPPSPFSSLR